MLDLLFLCYSNGILQTCFSSKVCQAPASAHIEVFNWSLIPIVPILHLEYSFVVVQTGIKTWLINFTVVYEQEGIALLFFLIKVISWRHLPYYTIY